MQISNSKAFKEDYKKISKFLSETENETLKKQVKGLFNELTVYVKKIDGMHSDLITIGKLSDNSGDIREKIFETRKKIFKIIDKI